MKYKDKVLFCILLCLLLYGEYNLFIVAPKYSKPVSGIVIHSYESKGRHSSCCFSTVRFENGDVQEVNTGHYLYRVGEAFTGQLSYNWFFGVTGFAYSWNPGDLFMIIEVITVSVNTTLIISGILILVFMEKEGE